MKLYKEWRWDAATNELRYYDSMANLKVRIIALEPIYMEVSKFEPPAATEQVASEAKMLETLAIIAPNSDSVSTFVKELMPV